MLDTPLETDADLELGPDDVGGLNWSFMFRSPGMKVIRHAGVDSRMIILDDQARQ